MSLVGIFITTVDRAISARLVEFGSYYFSYMLGSLKFLAIKRADRKTVER